MSWSTCDDTLVDVIHLQCDGVKKDGNPCGNRIVNGKSKWDCRRRAKGWDTIRGKDFCPECLKDGFSLWVCPQSSFYGVAKGEVYEILGVARHAETDERMVVYKQRVI